MAKREVGTKRKDGRRQYTVSLGADADGKRLKKTVYGRTQTELKAAIDKVKLDADKGIALTPERLTVGDLADRWLEDVATHRVRPTTLVMYRSYVVHQIRPQVGAIRLKALTPMHVQRFISHMIKAGLKPASVRLVHRILRTILRQAVRWELLSRNPADSAQTPAHGVSAAKALTADQLAEFLNAAAAHRMFGCYYLAAATGMRRGELLALRWADVDLDQGLIRVRRNIQWLDGGYRFDEPKTPRSRRDILLPPDAIPVLRRHRSQQAQERLQAGRHWHDLDLVFCLQNGEPPRQKWLTETFQAIMRRAGLPQIRLHDLRHTHATLLLEHGVNIKIVSARLGHSSISVTGDLYSHVTDNMQQEAARVVQAILQPRKQAPG